MAETVVHVVTTKIGFLRALLREDDVRAGVLDTGLVARVAADLANEDDT